MIDKAPFLDDSHTPEDCDPEYTDPKLFIPIILGTNREGNRSRAAARLIKEQAESSSRIETTLIDVGTLDFPQVGYGTALRDQFPEYRDAVIRADALIIVAPEYNHGYPGTLKTLLDTLLPEYIHKAVGLAGVSKGPWGGKRVIEQLVGVVRELGLAVTFNDLSFSNMADELDDNGEFNDPDKWRKRTDEFLEELIWVATVLRWGRAHIPSRYVE